VVSTEFSNVCFGNRDIDSVVDLFRDPVASWTDGLLDDEVMVLAQFSVWVDVIIWLVLIDGDSVVPTDKWLVQTVSVSEGFVA